MKQRIDYFQCKAKNVLEQRMDFPFEKRIETMDSLPVIEDQKIVETTVRFSVSQKNSNIG